MGNNVLPARAGDAIRVVLMAPRAGHVEAHGRRHAAWPSGCSTSLVLVVLFVVVGYGLLGTGRRRHSVEIIAGVVVGLVALRRRLALRAAATSACTTSSRPIAVVHARACAAPTTALLLLGHDAAIWAIETAVWMSVGAAVGFGMDPIEGSTSSRWPASSR